MGRLREIRRCRKRAWLRLLDIALRLSSLGVGRRHFLREIEDLERGLAIGVGAQLPTNRTNQIRD